MSIPAGRPATRSWPAPASLGCACAARSSGTSAAARSRSPSSSSAGQRHRRPARVRQRQVLPRRRRREPHRGDARSVPGTPPGRATDEYGIDMYARADLERFVRLCDAEEVRRPHPHHRRQGRARSLALLNAIEAAARANGRRDARHQLAHVQFAHPDDLPRFRSLGVIANVTPLWARLEAYVTEMTLPFVSARGGGRDAPLRQHRPGRRGARVRERLVGVHARPAPPAGSCRVPARPGAASAEEPLRRSGSTWARRSPPTPSAPPTPAGSDAVPGVDRARQAGRPGGARSRPVRPGAGGVPARHASSPPSSRARSSTPSRARALA